MTPEEILAAMQLLTMLGGQVMQLAAMIQAAHQPGGKPVGLSDIEALHAQYMSTRSQVIAKLEAAKSPLPPAPPAGA